MAARSPTAWQFAGFTVTLFAVALFCGFTLWQVRGLRELQSGALDRLRGDSLQLVRIQNDLTHIGLALIDVRERPALLGAPSHRSHMQRLRADLDAALKLEARLAAEAGLGQRSFALQETVRGFWSAWEAAQAEAGPAPDARALGVQVDRLDGLLVALDGLAAQRLSENQDAEARTAQELASIYAHVERNIYLFVGVICAAVSITGVLVLRADRRMFREYESLSERRRELAAKVMTVQEETFRQLAREIHDEFGQVLTALGMMVARVEKKLPPSEDRNRADLREVREIAQHTLERARTLSQMLHPPVLDDYGLERSVEWYLGQFQRQTGIEVHYGKTGAGPLVKAEAAIHIYRVLQEALSNVARHAGVREVWVRAHYAPDRINIEIEDHGCGMPATVRPGSIGLVAMRERAGLLHGNIEFSRPQAGGTRVELRVPSPGEREKA